MNIKYQNLISKVQDLYIKIDAFWDSLPKPVKVFVYGLISILLTKLSDDIINGVSIDPKAYYAIAGTYAYNAFIAVLDDIRKGKLEVLKDARNSTLMDRP